MDKDKEMEIEPTQLVETQPFELSDESIQEIDPPVDTEQPRSPRHKERKIVEEEKESPEEDENSMEEEDHSSVQNIEGDNCEVCYSRVSRKFLNEHTESYFDLIQCKTCGKKVHHICYGVDTPVEIEAGEDNSIVKYFLCDHCKGVSHGNHVSCYICGVKEGCLRLTTDGKWMHTLCGVGSHTVAFTDVAKMAVDLSAFRKRTQKINASRKCVFCKSKVNTFKCTNRDSTKWSHLHCALRRGLLGGEKNAWKVKFALAAGENLAFGRFVEEDGVLLNIEDMALSLGEVIEDTGLSKTLKGLKASKVKDREKKRRKEGPQGKKLFKDLYQNAKKKAEKNLGIADAMEEEIDEKDEELDVKCLGGKILLIDPEELSPEEREELQEEESDAIDEYLMNLEGLGSSDPIKKTIQQLSQEINSNKLLEVYSEQKLPKLINNLKEFPEIDKLNFPEVLLFVNIFQQRTQAACNNLCELPVLEGLLKQANSIPFSMVSMLRLLNKKYYTGLAADALLDSNVKNCVPESAYLPTKKRFDEATIRRNRNVLEQATEIEKIYLDTPCKTITPQYETLKTYRLQLAFLSEVYSEIADYFNHDDTRSGRTTATTKAGSRFATPAKEIFLAQDEFPNVPLTRLLPLHSKMSSVGLPEDFEEVQLLKQIVGKPKGLLDVGDTRDFLSDISGKSSPNRSPRKIAEGKKSLPKYVEIIPASPIVFSARKGRPKNPEKVISEIERDHRIQMKRINELPTLQEADDALLDAKRSGFQKKVELTQASIDKAIEWKAEFEKAVDRNNGKLGDLIEKIEMVGVYVPEMSRALELRKEWGLWRSKIEELHRRLKKKVGNFFGELDDMVPFEEIEEVVKEGQTIVHVRPDDGEYKEIKARYKEAKKIQDALSDEKERPNFTNLKQYKKEIMGLNIRIPEAENLQTMVAINENIKKKIDETASLKKLEETMIKANYVKEKVDPNILQELETKLTEGKRIKELASNLLTAAHVENVDYYSQLAVLAKDVNMYKVEVEEIEKVQRTVDEFLRLAKMYALVTDTEPISLRKLEKGIVLDLEGKTVDEIIAEVQRSLEGNENTIGEKKAREIEEVFRGFNENASEIHSVKVFLDRISQSLWKIKAKNLLLSDYKRTSEDIKNFLDEIPQIDKLSSDDVEAYRTIQQIAKKARNWKEEVEHVLKDYKKENFVTWMEEAERDESEDELQVKLQKIHEKTRALVKKYQDELTMFTDIEGQKNALFKVSGWVEWILKAIEMKAQVEVMNIPLRYSELKEAFDKMDQLALPNTKGFCKVIGEWYIVAEKLRKEVMDEYYERRVEIKKGSLETVPMRKLMEKNQEKIDVTEAEEMLKKLESGSKIVVFPEQIEGVRRDIQELKEWANKVKEVKRRNAEALDVPEEGGFLEIEISAGLKGEISRLKQTMIELRIRDEEAERELLVLDWAYEAAVIVRKVRDDAPFEEYKKLLKNGKGLILEENVERLYDALSKEVEKADEIKAFARNLKKVEGSKKEKIAFDDIELTVADLGACRIPLREEKREIEHIYAIAKRLREKARNLVEPEGEEKGLETEFRQLRTSIKKLPIDLSQELKRLEKVMSDADKLSGDAAKKTKMRDLKYVQKIVKAYKECPMYLPKLAQIVRTYEGQFGENLEETQETQIIASLLAESEESEQEKEKKKRKKREKKEKMENEKEEKEEKKERPRRTTRAQKLEEEKSEEQEAIEEEEEVDTEKIERAERLKKEKAEKAEKARAEKAERKKAQEKASKETELEKFIKKCEAIEKKKYRSSIGPALRLSISDLKSILKKAKDLEEEHPEKKRLEDSRIMIDELLKDAEDKVEELQDIKKKKQLDDFPKLFMNVIDFSKEIAQRKRQLTKSSAPAKSEKFRSGSDTEERPRRKRGSESQSQERAQKSKERSREREKMEMSSRKKEKKEEEMKRKKKSLEEKVPIREKESPFKLLLGKKSPATATPRKEAYSVGLRTPGREGDLLHDFVEDRLVKKAEMKRKHLVIAGIKNVLEANSELGIRFEDLWKYATKIYDAIPELPISKDSYQKIVHKRLEFIVSSHYLMKSIMKMNFDETYIRHLAFKDQAALKALETRLQKEDLIEDWLEGSEISSISESPRKETREEPEKEDSLKDLVFQEEMEEESFDDVKIKKKSKKTPMKQEPLIEETRFPRSPSMESFGKRTPKKEEKKSVERIATKPKAPMKGEYEEIVPSKIVEPTAEQASSNLFEPYNPDEKIGREERLYNPEKVSVEKKPKVVKKKIPETAVLQVFSGHLTWLEGFTSPNFNLYTSSPPGQVQEIPALEGRLNKSFLEITEDVSIEGFSKYFEEVLSDWRKEMRQFEVIIGWFEPQRSAEVASFQEIAQNLIKTNMVAACEYTESASLFIIPKQQMRRSWAVQLGLKITPVLEDVTPDLLFIVVQTPAKMEEQIPSIAGRVVFSKNQPIALDQIWETEESEELSERDEEKHVTFDLPSKLGKRSYEKFVDENEVEEDLEKLEKLIKKVKTEVVWTRDKQKLINSLGRLEDPEILSIAKSLDGPTREYMINLLKDSQVREEIMSGFSKESLPILKKKWTPDYYPVRGTTTSSLFENVSFVSAGKNSAPSYFGWNERRVYQQPSFLTEGTNRFAFANLQPEGTQPVVEQQEIEEEVLEIVGEEENMIVKDIDWSKLIHGELDLGGGVKLTPGKLTMPKEVYEAVMEYRRKKDSGELVEEEQKETQEIEKEKTSEEIRQENVVEIEDVTNEKEEEEIKDTVEFGFGSSK